MSVAENDVLVKSLRICVCKHKVLVPIQDHQSAKLTSQELHTLTIVDNSVCCHSELISCNDCHLLQARKKNKRVTFAFSLPPSLPHIESIIEVVDSILKGRAGSVFKAADTVGNLLVA